MQYLYAIMLIGYARTGPRSVSVRSADGTAQRESLRRFLHLTVAPLARLVDS